MERPASAGGATPTPPKRRRRPATAEPRVFLPAIQSPGARRLSFPSPATTWNDLTKEVVAEKLGEQTEKERGGQVRRPSLDETKRTPAPASEQAVDGNVELDVTAWTQTVDTVHDDAAAGDGQTALGHLRQQLSTAEVHASVRWLLLAFLCAALSTSLGYASGVWFAKSRGGGCYEAKHGDIFSWLGHCAGIGALAFTWAAPVVRMNLDSAIDNSGNLRRKTHSFVKVLKMVGWLVLASSTVWSARLAMYGSQYRSRCCAYKDEVNIYRSNAAAAALLAAAAKAPVQDSSGATASDGRNSAPSNLVPSSATSHTEERGRNPSKPDRGRRLLRRRVLRNNVRSESGSGTRNQNSDEFTISELQRGVAAEGDVTCGLLDDPVPNATTAASVGFAGVVVLISVMFVSRPFWAALLCSTREGTLLHRTSTWMIRWFDSDGTNGAGTVTVLDGYAISPIPTHPISWSPNDSFVATDAATPPRAPSSDDAQIVDPNTPPLDAAFPSPRKAELSQVVAIVVSPGSYQDKMQDRLSVARVEM